MTSFVHLAKKRKKRKERKERKEKENQRKNKGRKEKKREKKEGGEHGSKGEGRRRITAARETKRKAPRATTDSREPPTSVKLGKPSKPIFRTVFILNLKNSI